MYSINSLIASVWNIYLLWHSLLFVLLNCVFNKKWYWQWLIYKYHFYKYHFINIFKHFLFVKCIQSLKNGVCDVILSVDSIKQETILVNNIVKLDLNSYIQYKLQHYSRLIEFLWWYTILNYNVIIN